VGALTLKNFPFELRGWEIHKFKSFDPTDNYLSPTLIYLNKNEIVQIESTFNEYNSSWLSDKARHYFDTIFEAFSKNKKIKIAWLKLYNQILTKVYISEHCRRQISKNYFFTIVFDYLSIELLAILSFISDSYSFISLKQAQSCSNLSADLESNFQVTNLLNRKALINSNLCLLLATNPRYEGYFLNLTLRQRVLKKKFKCILIGSLINLTYPVSFIGNNTNIIKSFAEGNNFTCQNLKYSINPFLICNTELFKRSDSKTINQIFKVLFYSNFFSKAWSGLNILSSTMGEVGMFILNHNKKLKLKDLNNFSSIYFINTMVNKIGNFKKITELQLFLKEHVIKSKCLKRKCVLDQNYKTNKNLKFSIKNKADYLYVPTTTFYENQETFISTTGFIKRSTKIISKNKSKSTWQILRKIIKHLRNKLIFFNKKDNQILFFNLKKLYNFKNYINFQYYPVKKMTNLSYYLSTRNKIFTINKFNFYFKIKHRKLITTKLKYWMNNIFNSNKDQYSSNSNILINCSKQVKYQTTNFF